jgi:hypothetical protein
LDTSVKKGLYELMRIIQNAVMPLDDQFRIRCDKSWKAALEDVAGRRKMKFAEWVRFALAEQAIRWFKENKLPVPDALVDLTVNEEPKSGNRAVPSSPLSRKTDPEPNF